MTRLTRTSFLGRILALAGLLAATVSAPAAGQSLYSNRGLGLVVEPQSARSVGLGGVALGLPGPEISWPNPAGAVGLPAAGLMVSFQFDDFTAEHEGIDAEGTTARFPLLLGAFPFGDRWVVTAGLGGFLDQRWSLQRNDTLIVDEDTLSVTDVLASEGGVSRLRFGAGYRVVDGLAVGVGLDLYTGGVQRTVGRVFPGEPEPRCCRADWRYSGVGFLASADWNPHEAFSLSVAGSLGGTLDADPQGDADDTDARSYDLPVSLTAGASARVAPNLLVATSGDWTGWSALQGALTDGDARDAWSAQGGVEWDALQLAGRAVPIRAGGRYGTLPFRRAAGTTTREWATERAITAGTGIVLGGGAAAADLSLERGTRGGEGTGLDESFWRFNLSVTVLGR